MRLAICKIGANVTFSSSNKSAANADILYFLRQLEIDEHDVTIHTHRTRNTFIPKRIGFKEIQDTQSFNEYDKVLVFNGSINFFGGQPDYNLFALYRALAKTEIPIVYVNTDGALPMKQLWPVIRNREWAKLYVEEDFHIDEDKVTYLTQGRNMAKMKTLYHSKPENIVPIKTCHSPLYQMILAKAEKFIKPNPLSYDFRRYDLGFGGYVRNTYKRKRIEHYYNSNKFETLLFGNLRTVNCPNTEILPKVSYQDFIKKMNMCRATIIIGDLFYENNFFTLRMYESLLADNMVFIDERLDVAHEFYGSNSNLYINSLKDVEINPHTYLNFKRIQRYILLNYDYQFEKELLVSTLEDI